MKKIISIIMAVAMIVCFASVVSAADAGKVLAHYTFDENKADSGLTAEGNVTFADGAAAFDGDSSWLKSDASLAGLNAITVAVRAKGLTNIGGGGQWIYDITSQETHNGGEYYFGLFYENGVLHAEAYAGSRPAGSGINVDVEDGDDAVEIVVTYSAEKVFSVYINGELAGSSEVTEDGFDLASILGESPVLQLGKCNWDSGYYANGLVIDEVVVYNTALSEKEVAGAFTVENAPADGGNTDDTTGGKGPETAPQTGFATIALAVAAIGSGAYIVSKKRH